MTEETAGTSKFEFLLNTLEKAASSGSPYKHGYSGHRAEVLRYVAALEREVAALTTQRDYERKQKEDWMAQAQAHGRKRIVEQVRAQTAEAELDAAKRALAGVVELAQVSYAEAIEHAKQAIAAKSTKQEKPKDKEWDDVNTYGPSG